MGVSVQQVKVFANGVKSVLTRQTKNKPAVLKLYNLEGKMISYREIQRTHGQHDYNIKKLTANAGEKGDYLEYSSRTLWNDGVTVTKMKMNALEPVQETHICIEEGIKDVRHRTSFWNDFAGLRATINKEMKVLNQNKDMGFWAQGQYYKKADEISDRWNWMSNWQHLMG